MRDSFNELYKLVTLIEDVELSEKINAAIIDIEIDYDDLEVENDINKFLLENYRGY